MNKTDKETEKTDIELLLGSVDKQLLVTLLDTLINEQLPTEAENVASKEGK